jgi:hypothetical protein
LENFTDIEQEIGKAQIALGKKFIKENLQEEISLSPMDLELNKAKVTLMMDGGWDRRASGRAFNSLSGRVVSVGPLTNKVCGLVYYSKNKRFAYHQQLKVKKKYLSPVRMRRCYHEFCNNMTEQLHGFVVNVFLPKRSYF